MTYIIYLEYPPLDYILQGVQNDNIKIIRLEGVKLTFLQRRIRKIMQQCGFLLLQKQKYFTPESLQALASIEPEANVIVIDIFRLRELIIINHVITSKAIKYLFYWTPIYQVYKRYDPSSRNKIIKLLQYDFILTTFNYPDAHQYQLIYKGSFFRYPDNIAPLSSNERKQVDCYFIGYKKDRAEMLEKCQEKLESHGLTCQFLILEKGEAEMTYQDNLKYTINSRCLVDITNTDEQTGLSLRPLEALFFNKKLITNNPNIRNYSFYHPDNVFIIGENKEEDILAFMSAPLHIIPDEIKEQYEINHWITNFLAQ